MSDQRVSHLVVAIARQPRLLVVLATRKELIWTVVVGTAESMCKLMCQGVGQQEIRTHNG